MIDTTGWHYLHKLGYKNGGEQEPTNLLYTPLLNSNEDMLCMWYDETSEYQQENKELSAELVNFFFEREVKYLTIFQKYDWAPKIIDIDYDKRKIFIEFNKETLNHIVMGKDRILAQEVPNWREQVFAILKDIDDAGYYKLALYPHCFFVSKDNKLKIIDFYACIEKHNCCIERSKIEGMIGKDSTGRFDNATQNDVVNFEVFFKTTMLEHLTERWKDNSFPEFYNRLTCKQ
jgi:hypothetical protein